MTSEELSSEQTVADVQSHRTLRILRKALRHKFTISIRFAALRLLSISSILNLIYLSMIYWGPWTIFGHVRVLPFFLFYMTIFVHHSASAFGPKYSPPRMLDFVLMVIEASIGIFRMVPAPNISVNAPLATGMSCDTWGGCWFDIIFGNLLLLLLLFRILDLYILKSDGGYWKRYDLAWPTRLCLSNGDQTIAAERQRTSLPARIFLGNWKQQLPGELDWMVYIRGVMSISFVIGVLIFGWNNAIVEPTRATAMTLVREHRSNEALQLYDGDMTTSISRRVIMISHQPSTNGNLWPGDQEVQLGASRTVSAVAVEQIKMADYQDDKLCKFDRKSVETLGSSTAISISCSNSSSYFAKHDLLFSQRHYLRMNEVNPDLLVSVNFSMLNVPSDPQVPTMFGSVQIYYGLTNNTQDVISMSAPTTLIPGVNLVGMLRVSIRRKFVSPRLSLWGISGAYQQFAIAEMQHVWPDRRSSNKSPEIGTLRIALQRDISEWRTIEDYREKSILNGFASVGGLWTFLAGIFTAIFGTSIMKILFSIKPLSVFGLIHYFGRARLREACFQEFPRFQHDLQAPPSERGLLALIYNHLLDLDVLVPPKQKRQDTSNGVTLPSEAPQIDLQIVSDYNNERESSWEELLPQ